MNRALPLMPTYEYICDACHTEFEKFQSIKADPVTVCPTCGKEQVRRKISGGAAIIFKGGGFYGTDYRSSGYNDAKKKDTEASTAAAPTADAKTETKSDAAKADAAKSESAPKPAAPAPAPAASPAKDPA